MTIRRYDLRRFFVSSRTRQDVEHLVDTEEAACSCEACLDFATEEEPKMCAHLEAAIAYETGSTEHQNNEQPLCLIL